MKWLFYVILSGIFVISPYFKGLYFDKSTYGISIVFFVLFFILIGKIALKKELNLIKLSLPIFLLPFCYFISFFFAENPKGAMDSIITWTSYASFFILLFWCGSNEKIKASMPFLFHLTGLWIAGLTLLVYYGILDYRSAIVAERFASIFQYPNTFGMVMAVFILFSLIMLTTQNINFISTISYSFPLIAYTACFIQSFSRGMFLIFPLCWFLSLFFFKLRQQFEYLLFSGIVFILSFFVFKVMENGETINADYPGLTLFISSTLLSIVLIYISKKLLIHNEVKFLSLLSNKKGSRYLLPIILILFITVLGLDFTNKGIVFNQFPEQLQARIASTNLETATAKERLIFFEDAFSITKDSPLIGFGGEAWASINKNYQQMPYLSNKAHNGYLEIIIDIGWLGFIFFTGIFGIYYWMIFKEYRALNENPLQIAVIISSIAILLHSFLDFDFSYSTVWFLLIWLIVMALSLPSKNVAVESVRFKFAPIFIVSLSTLIVGVSLFFSYRFILAEQHFVKFKTTKSYSLKKQAIEHSIMYNPFNPIYRKNLISLELSKFQTTRDDSIKNELLRAVEQLVSIEKNNSGNFLWAGDFAERIGEPELAISYYNQGLNRDHFDKKLYEKSIKLKLLLANNSADSANSHRLLKSALKDYEANIKWLRYFNTNAPDEPERFNSRNFQVSDESHIYASQGYIKLKDYRKALKAANKLSDKTIQKKRALAMIILDMEKNGQVKQAKELEDQYEQKFNNFTMSLKLLREKQ